MPLSQKCGEKQKGSAIKFGPHLSFQTLSILTNSLPGHPEKLSINFFVYFKLS